MPTKWFIYFREYGSDQGLIPDSVAFNTEEEAQNYLAKHESAYEDCEIEIASEEVG